MPLVKHIMSTCYRPAICGKCIHCIFYAYELQAQFKLPLQLIWGLGSDIFWTVGQMIAGDKILIPKYCETILEEELITDLEEDQYDLAIIDLMFNECGLALAHRLNLPVVGCLLHH